MNYMQLQALDIQEVEGLLRAAVPEEVSDAAFAAVNWKAEAESVVNAINKDKFHISNAALCAALGHNTAMAVLLAAD